MGITNYGWFLGKTMVGCMFFLAVLLFGLPAGAEPKGKLTVFIAGSLSAPFEKMEKLFEEKYPKVDVLLEAGGSTKMARMISELNKPADIMASADYAVIDKILIPQHADWNVRFATNQLVLCYTDKSKYADQVSADNWYDILGRKGVSWGHSDPNLDPCGYRALMVLQLAEKHYKKQGLCDSLLANRPKENIRPKSVELVSLLKTGNMDYAWEYLSVAVQHGLKYVKLPDEINLGNYKYDDFYSQAKVDVSGDAPGKIITQVGQSCTYGVTIIKSAPNRDAALAFVAFMLDPQGGARVMEKMGQPPFVPARVPTKEMKDKLPASIQRLVEIKD